MSAPDQPRRENRDDALERAMTARLFGELSEEERRRLDAALAASGETRQEWESLSSLFDALGEVALPAAGPEFEQEMLARLSGRGQAAPEEAGAATVSMVRGEVRWTASQREPWQPIESGETVHVGDAVEVGEGGRALLCLPDKSELWLNAETVLRFGKREAGAFVRLLRGEVLALMARQRRAFEILTQDGAVCVVGTVFDTRVSTGPDTVVSVLRGRVEVNTGSGRREIGAGQRLRVQRDRPPGRPHGMTGAEMRRLAAWAAPVRSASRMGEESTLDTVRREITMRGLLRIAGVAVIAAAALLGYRHWTQPPDSVGVASTLARVERATAEARRIEITEPVDLIFLPRPGDRWTETTALRGTVYSQRTSQADVRQRVNVRLVSEVEARAGTAEGEVLVEHTVREGVLETVSLSPTGPGGALEEGEREVEDLPTTLRIVEVFDAEGVRKRLEITGLEPDAFGPQQVMSGVFTTSHGTPSEPVVTGSTWTHRQPAAGAQVTPIDVTSTLDHFEEMDGERLAVIRSETGTRLTSPQDLGSHLIPGTTWSLFGDVTLREFEYRWEGETRHRLSDGRPVLTTGRYQQRHEIEIVQARPGRPERSPRRIHRSEEISLEATIEMEHHL